MLCVICDCKEESAGWIVDAFRVFITAAMEEMAVGSAPLAPVSCSTVVKLDIADRRRVAFASAAEAIYMTRSCSTIIWEERFATVEARADMFEGVAP